MMKYVSATDVAQAINERLGTITVASGKRTDIGLKVYRGRHQITDDMVPCAVIFEGDDEVKDTPGRSSALAKVAQRYVLVGYDKCDPDYPNDKAHDIIKDMKQVIFAGDRTFGTRVQDVTYKGRAIGPRADGVGIVSARIDIDITYFEDLANP